MNYDLNQPWKSLDPWQTDYIYNTHPNQNCFLLTGRQVGKTTAMSIKAVELCINHFKEGENILIVSVTEKQAYRMLAKAISYAEIKYPGLIMKGKDKATMHRVLFNKGKGKTNGIFCYAAGETGEGLRGDTIKKLMIDEGSRMRDEFFIAVTPMLSVINGSLDIASTPVGKGGFFYECSKDTDFKKFYISAEDCPRHSKEFLEKEKKRMSKLKYAQEYLALFLDELKRLFPEELIIKCLDIKEPVIKHGSRYLGVDVAGLGEDDTVLISMCRSSSDNFTQIDMQVFNQTYTTDITDRILLLDHKYDYSKIYIDDGGIGFGVFSELLKEIQTRRKVVAINNSARPLNREESRRKKIMKEDLYINLVALMEHGKVHLFKKNEIAVSLASVQYEYTEDGSMKIYGDDTHIVEALIRAVWSYQDKKSALWCR